MDEKENSNVRITGQAHGLLAEMARDCDTSMKDIASEAIIRAVQRNHRDSRFALGTFTFGMFVGGVLMFFAGMLW